MSVALETLERVQQRVLWLATRMVHEANHIRPSADHTKVGGHQASSASVVSIVTALYFGGWLRAGDRVSIKPHASPVYHVIQYLLGNLDRRYLTTLRDFGGLQAYPSRTKDPDPVDFSTGSVGLGAAAPLFAGLADRYAMTHFHPDQGQPTRRFIALVGDAELDEGNIWEAIGDETIRGTRLGNVLWIVDLNRQSRDALAACLAQTTDDDLPSLLGDLGGHDLDELLKAFRATDQSGGRPTVLFAYTMKGWGLPFAGDPLNHSALLSQEQIEVLREQLCVPAGDEWACFAADSPDGRVGRQSAARLYPPGPRPAGDAP